MLNQLKERLSKLAPWQNNFLSFINNDKKIAIILFILFYIIFIRIIRQIFFDCIKPSDIIPLEGVIYFIPETRKSIFWYIAAVPFTFLYMLSGYGYYKSAWPRLSGFLDKLKSKNLYYPFLAGILLISTVFFVQHNYRQWPFYLIVFLGIYLSPFIETHNPCNFFRNNSFFTSSKTYVFIFAFTLVYACIMFKPLLWDKLHIINEFFDIPNTSLISADNTSKQPVDTHTLMKKHPLWGISDRHNIRSSKTNTSNCIKVRETPELKLLIKLKTNTSKKILPFFYQKNIGLCFAIAPTPEDIKTLLELNFSKKEKELLNRQIFKMQNETWKLGDDILKKKKEFKCLAKNMGYQFHWQILSRGYIHHQNHLMAPYNEINLGRPYTEIFAQYGLLNAITITTLLKSLGGIEYNLWEKVLYTSFLLYFGISLFVCWKITKKLKYVIYLTIITVASISTLNFMYLYFGIPAHPRHFFDFPLFLTFYLYLKKNKKIYFLLSLLLCLLAVLNNTEFGLILFFAFAGTVFVKNLPDLKNKPFNFETVSTAAVTLPIIGAAAILMNFGSGNVAKSFLSGSLAFPIPRSAIIITLFIIFTAYFIFAWMLKKNKPFACLFMLILLYSQALLVYWFRSYAPYHVLAFVPIYFFGAMLALKVYFDNHPKHEKSISAVILWGLFIWLLTSIPAYMEPLKRFKRVFENNKTYEWTLPGTNFISTMDPKYFTDSVELIQKYSPQEKGIYIISQYDNFLPFISGRYSALPVIDLQWYLITAQDMKKVIKSITDAKPEYLFAERNLDTRRFEYDIINPSSYYAYLHEESVWRAQRMKQIQKIFRTVAKDYEPVESSTLLTVYKRKKHAE